MFELRYQKDSRLIWTTLPPSKYPPQQQHRCFVCQYIHKTDVKGTLVQEYRTRDESLCAPRSDYEYRNRKAI